MAVFQVEPNKGYIAAAVNDDIAVAVLGLNSDIFGLCTAQFSPQWQLRHRDHPGHI